ncbi:hypothetical protein [Janthinobacterium sp. 1_2014MBL_MicDiv]|uniref:hypothetical protein n=1 Tax=Janthinobacterium sp. 1_2014MBL_MicDiv TaxID=1644131 RepID=UPI000B0F1EFF|nr:hypothetical protein [Janthinobacterium sp. 1_2014MBL_MicDiv]
MNIKKEARNTYNPLTALHPVSLRPELEDMARELYRLACKGSEPLWKEMKGLDSFQGNPEIQSKFLFASHAGMNAAQKKIIELVQSHEPLTDSHDVLIKGITDAMVWQLIGHQLCHARRFYKEHPPVNLKESNFESVVFCANERAKEDPGSISIISDLTSFVQVGDLLCLDSRGQFSIAEVKEGKKNHEIMDFMKFFIETQCDHAFNHFAQEQGKSGMKQLQRMLRQTGRMNHVTEVMSKGKSVDPDTEHIVTIPEEFVYVPKWDEELNKILASSDSQGWGYHVIDNCLFMGAYSKDAFKGGGHAIFNMLFDEVEGSLESPRCRLNDCMTIPLALPVFNLNIPDEHKFDLLFGRKNVCLGLNITNFLDSLKKVGVNVREGTNKETSHLEQKGATPYKWKGKAIFVGNGKNEVCLSDGLFIRILFHGQRPLETVQAILNNLPTEQVD